MKSAREPWVARWRGREKERRQGVWKFFGAWAVLFCILLLLSNSLWEYLDDSDILPSVYRSVILQPQNTKSPASTGIGAPYRGFIADIFVAQGYFLVYYLYIPANYQPTRKYPLVLVMQGGGERSKANNTFLQNEKLLLDDSYASVWGADYNAAGNPQIQEQWPCFVLIPQMQSSQQWVNVNVHSISYSQPEQPSIPMMLTKELLDSLQKKYAGIDADRLYITGLSNGGLGTWDAITRWPDYFAAAAPIAGSGDPTKAAVLKDLPIWAFHGSTDSTVPVEGSRKMIEAIEAAGGHPKYTEFAGQGHGVWSYVYSLNNSSRRVTDFFPWLFAQHK